MEPWSHAFFSRWFSKFFSRSGKNEFIFFQIQIFFQISNFTLKEYSVYITGVEKNFREKFLFQIWKNLKKNFQIEKISSGIRKKKPADTISILNKLKKTSYF